MTRAQDMGRSGEPGIMETWLGKTIPCPAHLRPALEKAIEDRQYREGRFLLILGMIAAFASLAVDAVMMSDDLGRIALARLGSVVPVQIAALAMPRERLGWQKFLLGLSLGLFCLSIVYASSLAPSPADAFLAMGLVMMLGIAVPLLPLKGSELAVFVFSVLASAGALMFLLDAAPEFLQIYFVILCLAAGGAMVLARRMRWLDRQSSLMALQAEERAKALESSNARLTELSMQDPLTNLANRRWAEIAFARDFAASTRDAPGNTALLLIDLDHFKAFNDNWGHDVGDRCLEAVAEVMRHTVSPRGGMAARFGGEEFVILLRVVEMSEALKVAEELRLGVERIEIECGKPRRSVSCTTSIGIAIHEGTEAPSISDLLKRADEALYQAKLEGRNRFKLAS